MPITKLPFAQRFARLCDDGFQQGWHERNGGNLTYRLTPNEQRDVLLLLDTTPGPWIPLTVTAPSFAGSLFMATGTGCFMRNMLEDLEGNAGIVEIGREGASYRVRWGLKHTGKPTSEFESHLLNQAVRCRHDNNVTRVCYHMHGPGSIAMSFIVPLHDRAFTRRLWSMMTECVVVFPEGVGVVPWMVPGGSAIANATSHKMDVYRVAVWAHHGIFATGANFDETFGLAHTVEKASQLYLSARAANGGSEKFLNSIDDSGLVDTCRDFGISINADMLSHQ